MVDISNQSAIARVAPLVGAWIETLDLEVISTDPLVAPLVGAWIETDVLTPITGEVRVAPLVGAWIETALKSPSVISHSCRTPRGCVD